MDFNEMVAQNQEKRAMEIAQVMKSIESKLDEKIPREAVSQREAGKGQKLDYLEAWYVIDRLNKVFGNLGWCHETVENKHVGSFRNKYDKELHIYVAKVRIVARSPDGAAIIREGTGWGCDKSDQNPHEMAAKEAESDALKRAAMKFGLSMGLALYDKSQENVEDSAPKKQSGPRKAHPIGTPAQQPASVPNADGKPSGSPAGDSAAVSGPERKQPKKAEEAMLLISSLAKYVATTSKKKTLEELKVHLREKYGVDKKEQLSLEQATEFVGFLYDNC